MKNIKTEYIVLFIVIVMLSAYLVFHNQDSGRDTLPVLADISQSDITKLDISRSGTTISLIKKDGKWVTKDTGFPVDPIQINAMVDNIKALKITALVSESKDYGRYDLNEERKIKVTAFSQDKSVRSFDLGKTASSYRHTFIRIDNDPRVFHAEQNFREAFEKSENDLLDRKILSLDSESVSRIEGTVEGVVYGFEKKKAVESNGTESKQAETEKNGSTEPKSNHSWLSSHGKPADVTQISGLLNLFSNLSCTEFIKGGKKEDFSAPVVQLNLTGSKPSSLSIYAAKEGVEGYPAVSSESPFPFILSTNTVEEIRTRLKQATP